MVINKKNSQTRNTHQRMKILAYLQSVCSHPTAEQVYHTVKKDLPTVTLATVYRNLNILAEQGKILRLEINKEYHYDADICMHQHYICKKCDKITDVFDTSLSKQILNKTKNNFSADSVIIMLSGICKTCKQ